MEQIRHPIGDAEYRCAFDTLRGFKTLFWWLLLILIVLDLAALAVVAFLPAYRDAIESPSEAAQVAPDAPADADEAETPDDDLMALDDDDEPADDAAAATRGAGVAQDLPRPGATYRTVHNLMLVLLPVFRFVALVAALLLALTLLIELIVSLTGQLGGAGSFAGAFVWSALLALLFIPWDRALLGPWIPPSVMYYGPDLVPDTRAIVWNRPANIDWESTVLYWVRYVAYPAVAILILIVIQAKFSRGRKRIVYVEPRPVAAPGRPTA